MVSLDGSGQLSGYPNDPAKSTKTRIMNSKLSVILPVLASLILTLYSCSSHDLASGLPKDAFTVSVFNVREILEKADMETLAEGRMMRILEDELRNDNISFAQKFKEWREDPMSFGVDLRRDFFTFSVLMPQGEGGEVGFLLPVNDPEALKENIARVLRDMRYEYIEVEEEKYTLFLVRKELAIGWDRDKLLILVRDGRQLDENQLRYRFADYFGIKPERSLMSVADFEAFMDKKKDFSTWLSLDQMPADVRGEFDRLAQGLPFDWYGVAIGQHLAFNHSNVTYSANIFPNESIRAYMEGRDFQEDFDNQSILEFFPKSCLFSGSGAINVDGVVESFQDAVKKSPELQGIDREFHQEFGLGFEAFLRNFSGEVVFSLFDVEEKVSTYTIQQYDYYSGRYYPVERSRRETVPVMGMVLQLEEPDQFRPFMSRIVEKVAGRDRVQQYGDYYHFREGKEDEMFIAQRDKLVLIGNSREQLATFLDGGYEESLRESPMADKLAQKGFSLTLNLDKSLYQGESWRNLMDSDTRRVFEVMPDMFSYLSLEQVGDFAFQVVLELKEPEGNSLGHILKQLDRHSEALLQ